MDNTGYVHEGAESVASCEADDAVDPHMATETALERTTLARKEDVIVQWMKGIVFLVLIVTSILVSIGVYKATKNDQIEEFENAFKADALKLIESFNMAVERRLEAVDALSVTITAYAEDTGSTFPNVTISNFEVRCANSRVLSDTAVIHYYPIVTDETRKGWEAYQREHGGHFDKAYASEVAFLGRQDAEFGHDGRQLQDFSASHDEIMAGLENGTVIVAPQGSGPYLPLWQLSPVTPTRSIVNMNVLWNPAARGAYLETMRTGQAVIEAAANLNGENLGDTGIFWQMLLSMSQYRYDIEEYLGDPTSVVGYPVFDSFDLDKRKVVGVIGTNFYWRLYLKNVLPPNTKGIICVLENTRNQTFTYQIDDQVKYVGPGDLHDTKYDDLVQTTEVAAYIAKNQSPETKSYTSVGLNAEYCNYKLRIYPSLENERVYVNNSPITMTIIIVSVFAFTSLVFVMFTIAVNRRQKVVMDRAVASSSIVSSLFPSQVRDQLYQENENEKKKGWKVRDNDEVTTEIYDSNNEAVLGRPIAEMYEKTTIMFADMAGFTLWSSKRTPVQVFELLETIYKAFDMIALRRKVFKVETIGDCYVAVAGLPNPQEDHAVIMAKFADDCMNKMKQLTAELAGALGEDTADLALRVGLHSGSVTGGVLRGQKSRFQLFGDTMNTASRMESTGTPGRIHVTQATADELLAKGKSQWVAQREDKILAKGKGELQTYWVTPRSKANTATTSMPSALLSDSGADGMKKHGENPEIESSIEI